VRAALLLVVVIPALAARPPPVQAAPRPAAKPEAAKPRWETLPLPPAMPKAEA
jgi:hypothetical protein